MGILGIFLLSLFLWFLLLVIFYRKFFKNKLSILTIAIVIIMGYYMTNEEIKDSAVYSEYNKLYSKTEKDSFIYLDKEVFIKKCERFKNKIKGNEIIENLDLCNEKNVNKRLAYEFIGSSPVTILVKDDFLYKDTPLHIKRRLSFLYFLKYTVYSMDKDDRNEINKAIRDYKSGKIIGVKYIDIVNELPLCVNYHNDCRIVIRAAEKNELPEGVFFKVE